MEEVAKVRGELGNEGATAFYVYIAVDGLQFFVFLGWLAWSGSAAWPIFKKAIED